MKRSNRIVESLPPSGIRKFFDVVSETEDVISLGIGEPDFITPWQIREATIYALEQGLTCYTSNYGLLELRQEISHYLDVMFNLEYDPATEILVTTGVSEAFDLAIRAAFDAGDEVILHQPCYVSYEPLLTLARAVPVIIETGPKNNFRVTADSIAKKITPNTKALILSFPNNPTGAIIECSELSRIAELARRHDLLVISDEIYGELTYEIQHSSIANLPGMKDRTLFLHGFSKAFAMTGYRIGYAAGPRELIQSMLKIHQYSMLCAPIASQVAAIEALRNGKTEMLKMKAEYNKRRKSFVRGLNNIGLTCLEPDGAFYAFPSILQSGLTSEQFAIQLLKEEKVAVVPGTAFGACGEGFVRCSYAAAKDQLDEALKRLERFTALIMTRQSNTRADGVAYRSMK